jgi:D-alanine-D-alanine ligase
VSERRKIRVAVVFGGRGPEHSVSCLGGGAILAAIDRDRYEVVPVGITREGNWVLAADDPARLALTEGELPSVEAVAEPGPGLVPWSGQGSRALSTAAADQIPRLFGEVDVVLPVLHGPYGEDGTIQGLLEMAGVPYVGAGVLASAVSMDKEYMKVIFEARGLPVARRVVVRERDWQAAAGLASTAERKRVLDAIEELGWPVFVKPARGGSSIGTSRAANVGELYEAIELARQHDPKVLVEEAIVGAEIECSVLEGVGGGPPDASMPGQLTIGGSAGFYDFEAKYLDAVGTQMTIPAPIPPGDIDEIRRLAAAAFDAVSAEGLARVDFFYTPDRTILVNEINTMPGMTASSYFAKMWEASGLDFDALIDRLLQTALHKRPGLR